MLSIVRSLRCSILCLLVLAGCSFTLRAQVAEVGEGRMDLAYEEAFAAALRQVGVNFRFHNYRENPRYEGFRTVSGTLDLATGQGEFQTRGGIRYSEGSMQLDTDLLALEVEGNSLYVTALVKENGVSLGRHRIYDVIGGLPFRLPLAYGPLDSGTLHFAMDPEFWAKFNRFFQIPTLVPGPTSGELHVITRLLAPLPE